MWGPEFRSLEHRLNWMWCGVCKPSAALWDKRVPRKPRAVSLVHVGMSNRCPASNWVKKKDWHPKLSSRCPTLLRHLCTCTCTCDHTHVHTQTYRYSEHSKQCMLTILSACSTAVNYASLDLGNISHRVTWLLSQQMHHLPRQHRTACALISRCLLKRAFAFRGKLKVYSTCFDVLLWCEWHTQVN